MKTGSNGRSATHVLFGLALGGMATSTALLVVPSANGGVVPSAAGSDPVRSAASADKCRNSSQLYRCAGVTVYSDSFVGSGYISDYAHGRTYKVGVSDVRLQKWNYTTDRWHTKKVKRDYDGFHRTKDSAFVHPGQACRGKWRTVATFRWHRVGKSKVRSMTIKSRGVWCG